MVPRWIVATILVAAMTGTVHGQGLLDSVLGPGGLGIWGGGQSPQTPQFNNPQFYGGEQYPGQYGVQGQGQGYPPQEQYPQQAASPYQYGYPQQPQPYTQPPYSNEAGVYADWYQYPPAVPGGEPAPESYPRRTAPPVQYTVPPTPYPQQQQQAQGPPPQRQLRPGQYSPRQGPPSGTDDLPPGAVRVTTTTPAGTTVQYYPPAPDPDSEQGVAPQRPRPRRAAAERRRARPRPQRQNVQQGAPSAPQRPTVQYNTSSRIAVPQPVQIPPDRDPRTGWEATLDARVPADNL